MAADLVTIATTAVLTQFLTPAAKSLGEVVLERAKRVGSKATAYLAAVGRMPQHVAEKLLLPLAQAASLETDETLTNKWAALLANAADPAQQVVVHPSFAELLRQLTPTDARMLEIIATKDVSPNARPAGYLAIVLLARQNAPLTEHELHIITGNLARLGLCFTISQNQVSSNQALAPNPRHNAIGPGIDYVQITPFGRAFLAAVTPPTL